MQVKSLEEEKEGRAKGENAKEKERNRKENGKLELKWQINAKAVKLKAMCDEY